MERLGLCPRLVSRTHSHNQRDSACMNYQYPVKIVQDTYACDGLTFLLEGEAKICLCWCELSRGRHSLRRHSETWKGQMAWKSGRGTARPGEAVGEGPQ